MWTSAGPVGSILAVAVDPSAPATVYAGGSGIGVFKSTNAGASWGNFGLGSSSILSLAVAATTPSTVYAGTNAGGVFTNSTTGISWVSSGLAYNSVQALAAVPTAPLTVFAGTNVNGVMESTDGGNTWVKSGLGTSSVLALAIDPTVAGAVYAATGGGVFKSSDGGATWASANVGLAGVTVRALAADGANQGTLYAGTGAGVFKTTNGGAGWAPVNSGLTNLAVNAIGITASAQPEVYAGTAGGGVFLTTNGGGTWAPLASGLTSLAVNAVATVRTTPATVYAGTANGVFSYTEPVVCAVPSGLVNNTAVDPKPCARTGIEVSWNAPTAWGDSGIGSRTFDVLRNNTPIATGLAQATNTFTDTTAVPYVTYTYAVRADNGCGLSVTTVGAIASDTTALPAIQTQPAGATIWAGYNAVLAVTASGAAAYQWFSGASGDASHPITSATSWQYVTPELSADAAYWVQVSNACGSTASNTATVTLKWHRLRSHLATGTESP